MNFATLYLGAIRFPVTPAHIRFQIPTLSARYELIGAGEAEILQGAKLAEIEIAGFFPAQARHYAPNADAPQTYVDAIRALVETAEPVPFVYVGNSWDVNFLCSVQDPLFSESGGCFDVDYKLKLRKWVAINTLHALKPETRPRETEPRPQYTSYTVKEGDTLSHIAQYTLGSSSRWPEIYDLNRDIIANPNLIYPGQELNLPSDSTANVVPQRTSSSRTATSKSSSRSSSSRSSSSSSSKKSASSSKSDASTGANANTISPSTSVAQSTPRASSTSSQRTSPSPAPTYNNAASFYDAFAP